jgi:hypothetical protein
MTTADLDLEADLEWLKGVAGLDDDYLAQWDKAAWEQWARALRADPHGPNPSVPAWMRPLLTRWRCDFTGPQPSVAQLWPTDHDWFTEAEVHRDLTLTVLEAWQEPAPTLSQVRQAWEHATAQGATALMNLTVVPAEPWGEAVTGEIEAFYVTTPFPDPTLGEELTQIMGAPGHPKAAPFRNVTELMHYAGLPGPGAAASMLTWEWMY